MNALDPPKGLHAKGTETAAATSSPAMVTAFTMGFIVLHKGGF